MRSSYVGRKYLEMEIKLPEDMARRYGDVVVRHVAVVVDGLRRLIFVDNVIATLKVFWRFMLYDL